MSDRLKIRNFGQIAEVDLEFGDLTVLVGAQGTGKSLALEWLKVAMDGRQVISSLRDAGHSAKDTDSIIDLIFGTGMAAAWSPQSEVSFNRKKVVPNGIGRRGSSVEKVFFIPAHRSLLISDGWAARM